METSNPASGFRPGRPRIIPVLDLMGGRVVRAVGGRRAEYRPVRSVLTDSTEPGEVARALVAATGATCLYVADLNAITGGAPDVASGRAIAAVGVPVMCDGGFRTAADARPYTDAGVETLVVGTETATPDALLGLTVERVVVSIDMVEGRILGETVWGGSVEDIARRAVDAGVRTVLLLDLARTGSGRGAGTEALVAACKRTDAGLSIIAGGGVRTWADVDRLGNAGADAVLVASALHDGTLGGERGRVSAPCSPNTGR